MTDAKKPEADTIRAAAEEIEDHYTEALSEENPVRMEYIESIIRRVRDDERDKVWNIITEEDERGRIPRGEKRPEKIRRMLYRIRQGGK